jgi:hypothetical protein
VFNGVHVVVVWVQKRGQFGHEILQLSHSWAPLSTTQTFTCMSHLEM